MSFAFNTSQYIRFTGGGVAEDPTQYTIAMWVKMRTGVGSGNYNLIVRSDTTPASSWSHQLRAINGRFSHYTFDGNARTLDAVDNYVINRWYHIAGTISNAGPMKLYINGVDQGGGITINNLWTGGDSFWVAVSSATGAYPAFSGEMAEVCVWYKQLTSDEILTIASKVRFAPLQVQRQYIRLYLPMDDKQDGSLISTNYKDLSSYSNTQTRTNNPTCLADEISYP